MSGGANWEHSWVLRLRQSQDVRARIFLISRDVLSVGKNERS